MLARRTRAALLALLATWAVLLTGIHVFFADRGLDRLDESYIASLVAHPERSLIGGEVYLFGFVLHPFSVLTGDDLAAQRRLNVLLTFLLLWVTSIVVLRATRRLQGLAHQPLADALAGLGVAGVGPLLAAFGPLGPSYNSLAFQGLTLLVLALALLSSDSPLVSHAGALLLGVAGWLTFAAKPPTAVGAAVLAVLSAFLLRKVTWSRVGAASLGLALAAAATLLVAGMTPPELVDYLQRGLTHIGLLRSHQSLAVLLGLSLPPLDRSMAIGLLPLVVLGVALLAARRRAGSDRSAGAPAVLGVLGMAAFAVASSALLLTGGSLRSFGLRGLVVGMAVLAAIPIAVLASGFRRARTQRAPGRRATWGLALACLAGPYVFALFTNSFFWYALPHAAALWVLAALVLLLARGRSLSVDPWPGACLVVALSLAVTSLLMAASLERRFPEEPARAMVEPVTIAGGTVRLTPERAAVAREITALRERAQIGPDTPLIDLTGVGAGYVLQLGGRPLGRAFLIGAFPGGAEAAAYSLRLEGCTDRARAVVLYAPLSPWSTAGGFLGQNALDPERDYEVTGRFTDDTAAGVVEVRLLKPGNRVGELLGCP